MVVVRNLSKAFTIWIFIGLTAESLRVTPRLSTSTTHAQMEYIDLRSDTVTKPTPAMRTAMAEAVVGDDVFAEDPTVNMLEARVAQLFAKESALFFPTGTMANLAAAMSWCGTRGSEVIMGDACHMFLFEQAGISQIGGISPRIVPNLPDGTIDIDEVESAIRTDNIHFPVTELIAIENTHNYCGGRTLPHGYTDALCWMAHNNNVPVHMDGARIWHAATATSTPVSLLTQSVDSVSCCLSKGLGAPAGSMLVGPKNFIRKARRIRKALGGGMRQAGVLAAAGMIALDDYEAGILLPCHMKAKLLSSRISDIPGVIVETDTVDTNIILIHLEEFEGGRTRNPVSFAKKLKDRGLLVLPFGPRTLRMVTHRDLTDADVQAALKIFREVAAKVWTDATSLTVEDTTTTPPVSPPPAPVFSPPRSEDFGGTRGSGIGGREGALGAAAVTGDTRLGIDPASTSTSNLSPTPSGYSYQSPFASAFRNTVANLGRRAISGRKNGSAEKQSQNQQQQQQQQQLQLPPSVPLTAPAPTIEAKSVPDYQPLVANVAANGAVAASSSSSSLGTSEQARLMHQSTGRRKAYNASYEPVVIHGMSVSEEGFCVFLRGTECNRLLKIRVTPADPMADGLDRDQVDTSEAVTLLQLLQGIDMETFLAKDSLATKFATVVSASSSSGGGGGENNGGSGSSAINNNNNNNNIDGNKKSNNGGDGSGDGNEGCEQSGASVATSAAALDIDSNTVERDSGSGSGTVNKQTVDSKHKHCLRRVLIDEVAVFDQKSKFRARFLGDIVLKRPPPAVPVPAPAPVPIPISTERAEESLSDVDSGQYIEYSPRSNRMDVIDLKSGLSDSASSSGIGMAMDLDFDRAQRISSGERASNADADGDGDIEIGNDDDDSSTVVVSQTELVSPWEDGLDSFIPLSGSGLHPMVSSPSSSSSFPSSSPKYRSNASFEEDPVPYGWRERATEQQQQHQYGEGKEGKEEGRSINTQEQEGDNETLAKYPTLSGVTGGSSTAAAVPKTSTTPPLPPTNTTAMAASPSSAGFVDNPAAATPAPAAGFSNGGRKGSPGKGGGGGRVEGALEVQLCNAFETIALALRHNAEIEARTELLNDEDCSYEVDEIREYFPEIVLAAPPSPPPAQPLPLSPPSPLLASAATAASTSTNAAAGAVAAAPAAENKPLSSATSVSNSYAPSSSSSVAQ